VSCLQSSSKVRIVLSIGGCCMPSLICILLAIANCYFAIHDVLTPRIQLFSTLRCWSVFMLCPCCISSFPSPSCSFLDGDCCAKPGVGACSNPFVYQAGKSCGTETQVATCCVCPANTILELNSCSPVSAHRYIARVSSSRTHKCTMDDVIQNQKVLLNIEHKKQLG
jgi:hypothetical protein